MGVTVEIVRDGSTNRIFLSDGTYRMDVAKVSSFRVDDVDGWSPLHKATISFFPDSISYSETKA